MHRISITAAEPPSPGDTVDIRGDEAHHAVRVKRVEPGEPVALLDGVGVVVRGRVAATLKERGEFVVRVAVDRVDRVPPEQPWIEACTAVPKGPRVADLVDQLSQAGAAAWRPLVTERGRADPAAPRSERLERAAAEASKQCGRAHHMHVLGPIELDAALAEPGWSLVLADASGASPAGASTVLRHPRIRVLVGPEGGWTPRELDAARRAGAAVLRLGPHAMRIETAAVVACGVLMALAWPRDAIPPTGND